MDPVWKIEAEEPDRVRSELGTDEPKAVKGEANLCYGGEQTMNRDFPYQLVVS